MGFTNPIASGEGALIRPAIKSPNYDPGVAGWSINEDGSAEFQEVTIGGGGPEPDYVTHPELADAIDPLAPKADLVAPIGEEALNRPALRSANFLTGVSGWRITQGGDAEFDDIVARGTIEAGAGSVVGGLPVAADDVHSPNYVAGVSGWRLRANGSAEFANGTFRGTVFSRQPARRVGKTASSINIAAGTYPITTWGATSYNVDNQITFTATTHFVVPRTGIWLCSAALAINCDAAGGDIQLSVRHGSSVGATLGDVAAATRYVDQTVTHLMILGCSAPERLVAGELVWATLASNVAFDVTGHEANHFALSYVSDA